MSDVAERSANPVLEHRGELAALRAVATVELSKGIAVLLGACGVLLLMQKDPWDIAYDLLRFLHISPDHHFARVFLEWADTLTEAKLWAVVGVALAYASVRFLEGYGLWRARAWAEWMALISGAIYLPFELYKVFTRPNLLHSTVLIGNLAVVLYMLYLLVEARIRRARIQSA